jgi:hypothetical protein
MQLAQPQTEDTHGAEDDGGEQAGAIGFMEVIKGATAAIVVEQGGLAGQQTEVLWDESSGPDGDAVQGLACEQEVGHKQAQHGRGGRVGLAAAEAGQEAVEQARQVEQVEEAANDGCRADLEDFEASAFSPDYS